MKDKQLAWAKTILVAYDDLEHLCEAIDKLVDTVAANSFYMCGPWQASNEISVVSQKLINLSKKKIGYINLKVLVEKILKIVPKKHAKFLVLRYVKKIEPDEIAEIMNMSVRTYYRQSKVALLEFSECLEKLGFNARKLETEYLSDLYIASVYRSVFLDGRFSLEDNDLAKSDLSIDRHLYGIVTEVSRALNYC